MTLAALGRILILASLFVATIGVMLGKHAGRYIGRYAEMLGGLTLILIGGTILYQHLTA